MGKLCSYFKVVKNLKNLIAMRSFLFVLGLLLFSIISAAQQVARSMTSSGGLFVGFYEFKPPAYDANPTKKYPLIIFLHGIGERGNGTTELSRVTANGIPRNIRYGSTMTFTINGASESFLVLSPQLSASYGGWVNGYVDAMLEWANKNLHYDPDRVYLTGLSAGGGGTWDYVSSKAGNAGIFAAIAPVCGSSYTQYGMCYIAQAHLPVWAFHAMDDGTVPVKLTQDAIKLINACVPAPNPAPKVTYYSTGGHGIWYMSYDESHTYHNPNLYEWLLSKRRSTNGNGQNQAPVVQLNNDISLVLPANSTTLDGSKSYDFDGTISSYSWTKISGPGIYTIVSPTSAKTTLNNLVQGSYIFQLNITDDKGASGTEQIKVFVQNAFEADKAPVVNAGNDFTSSASTVYLSGAGSYDPDGTIASYKWTQIAGPSTATITGATTVFPAISKMVAGTYKFRLLVTDNMDKSADDTVSITISTGPIVNKPPVAVIAATTSITLPVNVVTLDGSGSADSDGSISKFQWSEVSGPNSAKVSTDAEKITTVSGLITGTYVFQLKVTDNLGGTATAQVTISVKPSVQSNKPPIANAGNDFITPYKSYAYLSAGASYDPDGNIVKYNWIQTSGPKTATIAGANDMFVTVKNMVAGTYTFKLTVTDNLGASATDNVKVTLGSTGKPPVANAGSDFSTTNSYAYLSAGASYDSDGSITAYSWRQMSGPNTATILLDNAMFPTVKGLIAGVYTFRLKVTDNGGDTATDDVILTVKAKTATATASVTTESAGITKDLIAKEINDKDLSLYPNPSTNQVMLTFSNGFAGNYKVVVYDAKGKIVIQNSYSKQAGLVQKQLDVSILPSGMYYVEVIYEGNQKAQMQKLIKL